MITGKHWYVVYTKPKCEKKVAGLIRYNRIEAFCPVRKVHKLWSDRKKLAEEPLFTLYVFVYASSAEHTFIRQIPGVVNFVYWLNKPVVVKDEEVVYIKNLSADSNHHKISLEKAEVNMNESVKVLSGPFMNKEGNVIEVKHKTVKLYLPSLGYNIVVEFNKLNIQSLVSRPEPEHALVS
jgi:transcription antitermination factor NusG